MAASIRFPWETLRAMVGGASPIDVPRLRLEDLQEAEAFLACYGFRWDIPRQRAQVETIRLQALAFLEEEILKDLQAPVALRVPESLRGEADVRRILLLASGDLSDPEQNWACALLRVMHTVAHARSSLNEMYGGEIRAQILQRFEPHLHETVDGLSLGRGLAGVSLVRFDVRPAKDLRSVVRKLLHKVESVAAPVFDRVGVRFVTRERFDALRVIRYLRSHNVVMFANIDPTRSRNTLLDIAWAEREVEGLRGRVDGGELSEEEALGELRRLARVQPWPDPGPDRTNPYSSHDYHAIQFTCRQQIHIPDGDTGEGELRFFFPFEVQILDAEADAAAREGHASHREYQRRKRQVIRRRVLGPLLAR